MDMFNDELVTEQKKEIESLRATVKALTHDCKMLNNIYKQAWEIAAKVACHGEHTLCTRGDALFENLYESMGDYDDSEDLRGKY